MASLTRQRRAFRNLSSLLARFSLPRSDISVVSVFALQLSPDVGMNVLKAEGRCWILCRDGIGPRGSQTAAKGPSAALFLLLGVLRTKREGPGTRSMGASILGRVPLQLQKPRACRFCNPELYCKNQPSTRVSSKVGSPVA